MAAAPARNGFYEWPAFFIRRCGRPIKNPPAAFFD